MRSLLAVLIFTMMSPAQAAGVACFDIFEGVVTPAPAKDTEPKEAEPAFKVDKRELGTPIYSYGKRMTAEEIAESIEAGPVLTKRPNLSEAEIRILVAQTRDLLGDKTITEKNVFEAIFAAKSKYFNKLEERMKAFGQGISSNIREMRKRRLQFAFMLKAADPIQATTIYRQRWEAYYISKSRLIQYIGGRKATREAELMNNSRFILQGITEGIFKDLKAKVDKMYANGRSPEVTEIMSIYDQVYARTNDEFRYIDFYMKETLKDPTVDVSVKDNIDYILKRLSVNTMSQRLGIQILNQAYLDSPKANALIEFNRPQVIVYGLKEALKNQRFFNFGFALSAATQNVGLQLTKYIKPTWLRDGVRGLMMLNYNLYVLKMYLIPIESIVTAQAEKRGAIFEGYLDDTMNSNYSKQLMETLARLSSDRTVWKELISYVEKKSTSDDTYKVMLAQMKEAEAGIEKHGWISRFHETSTFDIWLGIGVRSTPIVAGTVAWKWDAIVNAYTHVTTAAVGVVEAGWGTLISVWPF